MKPVQLDEVESSRRTALAWASQMPFFAQIYELFDSSYKQAVAASGSAGAAVSLEVRARQFITTARANSELPAVLFEYIASEANASMDDGAAAQTDAQPTYNDWCGIYASELVGMLIQIHLSGRHGESQKPMSLKKRNMWRTAATELVLKFAHSVYASLRKSELDADGENDDDFGGAGPGSTTSSAAAAMGSTPDDKRPNDLHFLFVVHATFAHSQRTLEQLFVLAAIENSVDPHGSEILELLLAGQSDDEHDANAMEIDSEEVPEKAHAKKKKSGGGLFAKPALADMDDGEGEINLDDDEAPLPEPEAESALEDVVVSALSALLRAVVSSFENGFIHERVMQQFVDKQQVLYMSKPQGNALMLNDSELNDREAVDQQVKGISSRVGSYSRTVSEVVKLARPYIDSARNNCRNRMGAYVEKHLKSGMSTMSADALEEKWKTAPVNEELMNTIKDCEQQSESVQLSASFAESYLGGLVNRQHQVYLVDLLTKNIVDLNDDGKFPFPVFACRTEPRDKSEVTVLLNFRACSDLTSKGLTPLRNLSTDIAPLEKFLAKLDKAAKSYDYTPFAKSDSFSMGQLAKNFFVDTLLNVVFGDGAPDATVLKKLGVSLGSEGGVSTLTNRFDRLAALQGKIAAADKDEDTS